jgi:DNA repair protein RadC
MANFKKGSAAAKAFMAKLRAARGKTKVVKAKAKKVVKVKAKTKVVKYKTKKIGSLSTYNKAPVAVKKIIDSLEFIDNYNQKQKVVKTLEKKGYKIEFSMDGSIESLKKIPAKKVVNGWKKGDTNILEVGEKKYADKKNVRVNRYDNGTFQKFTSISGYKQTPEIIVGRVGAVTLLKSLAPEVKVRITRGKKVRTAKITSSNDTVEILKKFITPAKIQTQEYSFAMYLNNANNVLAIYQFGMGGFTATIMEKRLLMAAALKLGATAMILCHNHPSGNLTPSNADKVITKQIAELANIHDIKVLDHVILTREGYYSFANEGLI